MVERSQYLEKLKKVKDMQIIKVVSGVRRCGKSTLYQQFRQYLITCGVKTSQIIAINFEDLAYEHLLDYQKLYTYIMENRDQSSMTYIFLDEIQLVPQFQKVVDSLFIQDHVDLYITGSNAMLLSGELATLLSGRYIEISMLPLSFYEYCSLTKMERNHAWKQYFYHGGFPYMAQIEEEDIRKDYLMGIYHTVLLKDIVARKNIQDVMLLESIVKFVFDNIGSIVSSKRIADSLTSYGRKTVSSTVEHYIKALQDSFILYKVNRYDIKGKQYLKSLSKYYLVDIGLRSVLLGDKKTDIGHILENIVFLELLRRGYQVSIGKIDDLEIDFIAQRNGNTCYFQVAASVLDPHTFAREIAPLKKIRNHYPKYIITMDEISMEEDGIRQMNVLDFLLSTQ